METQQVTYEDEEIAITSHGGSSASLPSTPKINKIRFSSVSIHHHPSNRILRNKASDKEESDDIIMDDIDLETGLEFDIELQQQQIHDDNMSQRNCIAQELSSSPTTSVPYLVKSSSSVGSIHSTTASLQQSQHATVATATTTQMSSSPLFDKPTEEYSILSSSSSTHSPCDNVGTTTHSLYCSTTENIETMDPSIPATSALEQNTAPTTASPPQSSNIETQNSNESVASSTTNENNSNNNASSTASPSPPATTRTNNSDAYRTTLLRWIRINRHVHVLITIVALLLFFATVIWWVVLTATYFGSIHKECDVPLKAYFWFATIQLVLDVFRTEIMKWILRYDPASGARIPNRVVCYHFVYLIYAVNVLGLGIHCVFSTKDTNCRNTAPELFETSRVFIFISLASWCTLILGYFAPLCLTIVLLRQNWYTPDDVVEGFSGYGSLGNAGAPPECIEQLDVLLLEEFPDEYPKECCICMSDFLAEEVIVATECDHVFHKSCLKEWLQRARACPVCRSDIPSNECIPELVNASSSGTSESRISVNNNESNNIEDNLSSTSSDELILEPIGMTVDVSSSSGNSESPLPINNSNNESNANDNNNENSVNATMSTALNQCNPNVNDNISTTAVPPEGMQPHNDQVQNMGSRVEEAATSERGENTNTRRNGSSWFNWSRSLRLLGSYVPH